MKFDITIANNPNIIATDMFIILNIPARTAIPKKAIAMKMSILPANVFTKIHSKSSGCKNPKQSAI